MSLIGKILAFLNILGAVALVWFASSDYAKRRAWAFNQFQHDLVLSGLPLDAQEQASNEEFIVELVGDQTASRLFQDSGGNPVKTQLDEVNRVKGLLDGKIQQASGTRAQYHMLARILLPLADNYLERQQVLDCRSMFATDAAMNIQKERYRSALGEAVREATRPLAPGETRRTFEEYFRAALRAQLGETSDAFTTMLIKALPDDPLKALAAFDKAFTDTLEGQRRELQQRYDELFTAALRGPPDAQRGQAQAVELQKTAIARLLFGLCLFQAEDSVAASPPPPMRGLKTDTKEFGQRLVETDIYRNLFKRVMVVCGIRHALDAMSDDAAIERKLVDYLAAAASEERLLFVADHSVFVELLRKQAALVQAERALVTESQRKLGVEQEQVKRRNLEVMQHEAELKELQARTADNMTELRKLSQDLLDKRTEARDLIRKAQETEKILSDLEHKIRDLDNKRSERDKK